MLANTRVAWFNGQIEIVARAALVPTPTESRGAREAIQVSYRWHLLRNLGDAVHAVVDHHHGDLHRAAKQIDGPTRTPWRRL